MPARPSPPLSSSAGAPPQSTARAPSPVRRPTLNKPLARGPPPSFAVQLGLVGLSGSGNKRGGGGGGGGGGGKKSRPRERRERREAGVGAAGGDGEGRTADHDDGGDSGRSTPAAGPSTPPEPKPTKPKRKPGKAFSPCPRPQAGRRPLDRPRSTSAGAGEKRARRQAAAVEEEEKEEASSSEESSSDDDDEASVSSAPARKPSFAAVVGVVGAGKAKRGIWAGAGAGADGKKPSSSSAPTSAAPVRPSVAGPPKVERSPSAPTVRPSPAAFALAITPPPSTSRAPHDLGALSALGRPAQAVDCLAPPATLYPYMSPSPAGRRAPAAALFSPTSGRPPFRSPPVVQSRPSVALWPITIAAADEDHDVSGPPIPIRIPSPFVPRLPAPVVRRPAPAQSLTPVPLGDTLRSTIALGQTLRGRATMSATAEPSVSARSASPDKPAVDELEPKRKRRREATTAATEGENDKEDVGQVVKRRLKKKQKRAAGTDGQAPRAAPASASLSPAGMPLSTFKTYNPPLVKSNPGFSSSSSSTLAATTPSAASSSSASAAVTPPPPYLAGPRWFMPPSSFYFAPYQLPQRPVLGLQGWHKPLGVYPPGGGARDPPPSSTTARAPATEDDDEVVFLSEVNAPFH